MRNEEMWDKMWRAHGLAGPHDRLPHPKETKWDRLIDQWGIPVMLWFLTLLGIGLIVGMHVWYYFA